MAEIFVDSGSVSTWDFELEEKTGRKPEKWQNEKNVSSFLEKPVFFLHLF
jgi:hypothetical protein